MIVLVTQKTNILAGADKSENGKNKIFVSEGGNLVFSFSIKLNFKSKNPGLDMPSFKTNIFVNELRAD